MPAVVTGSSEGATAAPSPPRYFNWLWLALPLLIAAGLLRLDQTDADLAVSAWLYDPVAHAFPLRTTFFLETFLHHWTKYVVVLVGCLAWGGWLLTYAVPTLRPHRRNLLFLGLALALAPGAVSLLQLASDRHCPWDVQQFGGFVPYLPLLEATPAGFAPGHCFPARHASTGFCLMAFYFLGWSARRPLLAWSGLATGLIAGLVLGFGRIAQGAHFLSHVLWAGVVCWVVIVLVYVSIFGVRYSPPPAPAACPQRQ